jgi:Holliday junction resolvase
MRRAAHVDGNHAAVMQALRNAGIAARSLAGVGNDFPDVIAAFRGVNVLLEVKNPDSDRGAPSKLTKEQLEFIESWPGPAYVVWSPKEAVDVVIEAARPPETRGGAS